MGRRALGIRVAALAWIVGPLQFLGCHLLVQSTWSRPYSWSRNTISDLGNRHCGRVGDDHRYVCSPFHDWMNVSIAILGVLIIVGAVLFRRARVEPFASRTIAVLLGLAGAGYLTAALSPADVNENVHLLAAFGLFLAGNVALILAGRSARTGSRFARAGLLIAGLSGLGGTVELYRLQYLGLGLGGMERVVVFPLLVVVVLAGCGLLRSTVRNGV